MKVNIRKLLVYTLLAFFIAGGVLEYYWIKPAGKLNLSLAYSCSHENSLTFWQDELPIDNSLFFSELEDLSEEDKQEGQENEYQFVKSVHGQSDLASRSLDPPKFHGYLKSQNTTPHTKLFVAHHQFLI